MVLSQVTMMIKSSLMGLGRAWGWWEMEIVC